MIKKVLIIFVFLIYLPAAIAQKKNLSPKIQFDYELRLKVDFKQREAILKKNGEVPDVYEKALSFISGTVHAADITDIVEIGPEKYQINSTGTLNSALNFALQGQKLMRQSSGVVTKNGLVTLNYNEKRGNTGLLQARVNTKTKQVIFESDRTQVGTETLNGNLLDLLSVMYNLMGHNPPAKQSTFNVTDSKSLKRYTLNKAEIWDFPFNGQKVKAFRYFKSTTKDDNSTLEIWLTEKENIPLRMVVGLGESYGATIQVDLKKIPTVFTN
jgi:hypothetical protein